MSHLNPGPYICLWTTANTSIPVPPSCISDPPRHHLKPIQVSICAFNFQPGPAQWNSGHKILVSPSSMNRLHRLHTSTHIKVLAYLHPGRVSPQSRSWYLHLTSIPVTSHLHPCPEKCSSATPRSHLKPILVRLISIQVLPHLHPGQKVLISSRSLYCLTSTQITYHILSVHEVCSSSPPMSSLNSIQSP